ncbi:hypothetical protein EDD22DRAFT_850278 [Suillus occidentalis]|nr:hypothetical protein EDD22DRAFT_850278 [Suillus occidentalis]
MSASETANNALNATLADGNPQALKLSDEITRRVYGADATSFSQKLLSCAAVVRECSKAGTFEIVPDWTTVSDQDQHIKAHPQFQKMVGYSPPNDDSPGEQLGLVVQEDDNITDQPRTTTAEVQPTLLTPLAPASVPPSPPSPPLPPHPAPKHNLFVPGHVKRKLANNATKSQELAPKRKKQEASTQKEEASGSTGLDSVCKIADDSFWDANTKPADWGLDGIIVTLVEHSVRHHARKCNKCKKLGVPCLILPNKKVGFTRLACGNCDAMKVACTIDGVGVQKRMQVAKGLETATIPVKHSNLPSTHTPLEQPQPPTAQTGELEPTARDILQGIQDLGRRFDLLATGEWVDALEARVGVVEEIWGKQLAALEQHLNASEEQCQAMSLTLDKLSMSLRDRSTDRTAHRESVAEQSGPPGISGWEADSIASS